MPTNSQFTVATHILTLLAYTGQPMTSKQISGSVDTNPVVVRRIIGALQQAGMVQTQMGVDGGTSLSQPPADITLLAVYRATKQGQVLPMHSSSPSPNCPVGANIQKVLLPIYGGAQAALESRLAQTTIADISSDIHHQTRNS